MDQRRRLGLENRILQEEGFDQFTVYHNAARDSYYASGTHHSNSGRRYGLFVDIPTGYPSQRPLMYLTEPHPALMANGGRLSDLGVSHAMHTLTPHTNGMVQICHWRDNRWHAGIPLQKVFLKGLLWIEAYEQHLATGHPISEFVRTMAETT